MSLGGVYDPDNIFARIIRGEVPCAKVFEDGDTLAFMDAFPQSRGHTLAVHKRSRARNLLDVEADDLRALAVTTQRVTRAVCAALGPDGVRVMQFNGPAAGQTIFHLHFHILPVWSAVPPGRHASAPADPDKLAELARLIAAQITP
jgi:histidine triad (HIT) family protein